MQTENAFKVQKVHLNEKNADKNAKNADRNEQTIQDKTIQYKTIQDETRRDDAALAQASGAPRPHPIKLIFSMRSTNGIEVMEHADVSLLFRRVSAIIALAEKEAVVYDDFLHRVQ